METIPNTALLSESLPKTIHATDEESQPTLISDEKLHYPTNGLHFEQQPSMILRRRCRSECLQMSPIVHHPLESSGIDQINELVSKPMNSECRNIETNVQQRSTFPHNGDNGVQAVNSKRIVGNFEPYQPANFLHEDNIKENISMDECDNNVNEFSDFTRYEKLQIYGDNPKKQHFLYNLNEEGDKEYFDIFSMVARDFNVADVRLMEKKLKNEAAVAAATVAAVVCHNGNGETAEVIKNGHRRPRARSESEHAEFYQVPKQHVLHSDVSTLCLNFDPYRPLLLVTADLRPCRPLATYRATKKCVLILLRTSTHHTNQSLINL